ncbi:MAG: PASTA domain-containing protein [Acidobacteria bacterium]|nr:PASTA domain-containing protein [Acidobacteriota bacterium]MSO61975.1 PASTA domain-containing protein [Acidobacteriota bacterium]
MSAQPDPNWRPVLRRRLMVAAGVLACWVLAIEARLVVLQVVQHDELSLRAERQQSETQKTPGKRGEIYDRKGRLLAYSVDADTIYAVPTDVADPATAAALLCAAFDECTRKDRDQLRERLSRKRRSGGLTSFQYVKRRATPIEAKRIAALELKGIGFMKESKRFYPNRELAAHLLGYVGTDNAGLHGLEATFDKTVRGREGTMLVQTDARGHAFSRLDRPPTTGGSLELTIDQQLQYIVERELKAGVEAARADGGTAVAMDPRTGEILAMASWPTFNPNQYAGTSDSALRNRAVQDLYEPGSTFKLVTASAAIEEKVVTPGEIIDVSAGLIRFGSRVIDDMHRYGPLSFTDVIVKSSNVGAIKVGLKLGPERMGLYIRRFGFGRASSPDFPGESPGIVWDPSRLNDSALASVSMGYQIGVTPLQMAAAASVIANGGTLYEPHVVRATVKGGVRTVVSPKVVRRAILPATAATLTTIMEAVVVEGTAKRAALASYTVAGKTGTADKLVNGRYSPSQQNVSFVGFVPSRNPVMTVIVMVDSPRVGGDTGGVIAAPIFQRIADASLRQMGVTPTINQPPPVMIARRDQHPVTTAAAPLTPAIVTMTASMSDGGGLPDLRGMSARDALRELARLGLTARMQGTGVVTEQTPAPGSTIEPGAACTLVLNRRPPPRPAAASGDQR